MAGHLAWPGHSVTVFMHFQGPGLVREFGQADPQRAATGPGGAGADGMFCCVGSSEDLRSVTLGRWAFASTPAGGILWTTPRHPARVARELYGCSPCLGLPSSSTHQCVGWSSRNAEWAIDRDVRWRPRAFDAITGRGHFLAP